MTSCSRQPTDLDRMHRFGRTKLENRMITVPRIFRRLNAMVPPWRSCDALAGKGRMAKRTTRRAKPRRPASRRRTSTRPLENALAGFAHDIRTPLTGIIAIGELLSTSELGERERRWVGAARGAAEHFVPVTPVVVDAARAGARGFAGRGERFDARALAQSLAASCAA